MTTFLIFEKIFLKIENLMCVFKRHINGTQKEYSLAMAFIPKPISPLFYDWAT